MRLTRPVYHGTQAARGFDITGSTATLAGVKRFLRFALMAGGLWSAAELSANDWPQWRGPRRDGVCDETGLLQSWPEGGPKLLWKSGDLGRGYCAPIIVGNRIYLTGDVGDELHIFALDLDGKLVWKSKNGRAWNGSHPGARASCTWSDGRLYHLNAHGRVACLDAATGAEVWAVNILEGVGGKLIHGALSACLLVDGPRVIVTAGGSKALLAALDRTTGETVWASAPLRLGETNLPAHDRVMEPAGEVDNASYASPILFPLGQRRLIVGCSLRHVFGADADTGELLWSRPLRTRYSVIATTPVRLGDAVFVTAPDGDGGRLFRLRDDGKAVPVETAWRTELDCCQGGAVFAEGALFGARYGQSKTWVRLDAASGNVRSEFKGLAKGPLLYADHRLYCVSEEGEVALLKTGSDALESAGRFQLVPERKSDVWTHPVIANGRLYLRNHETLFCYHVRAK
jgi:outer membrane protein assembly factor BamB